MKNFLKVVGIYVAMCVPAMVSAQDKVEAYVSADLVSNYIWRGQDLGAAAVQPTLGVAWKGFKLEAWGNYGITDPDDTKELDLTLGYQTGGFKVSVVDYYYQGDDVAPRSEKFFNYKAHETAHEFEASVGYDFNVAAVSWSTIFAGNDGVNRSGKRAYSSYLEASAPFRLGGLDWNATVGAVPYATDYYEEPIRHFAVINVALRAEKEIKITPTFSLPLFASLTANPHTEKVYMTFGLTLR